MGARKEWRKGRHKWKTREHRYPRWQRRDAEVVQAAVSDWMEVYVPPSGDDYRKRPEFELFTGTGARHVIDSRGRGIVGRLGNGRRKSEPS